MFTSGKILFIEGPDCVGKSLFITRMFEYFRGEGEYAGIIDPKVYATLPPRKRKNARAIAFKDPRRSSQEALISRELRRHSAPFSVRRIEVVDGSPESRDFIRRMHAGEITDKEQISFEYLQIHNDYDNLSKELAASHDLVVGDRSMMTYKVLNLGICGHERFERAFEMLLERTEQHYHPVWILRAQPETIRKRAAMKKGSSVLDEFYTEQVVRTQELYKEAAESGLWKNVQFIDVDDDSPDAYRNIFANLARQLASSLGGVTGLR